MSNPFKLTEKQEMIINSEFKQLKTKLFEKLNSQSFDRVKNIITLINKIKEDNLEEYIVYFKDKLFVVNITTEVENEKEVISDSKAFENISIFDCLFTEERKILVHSKEVAELYISQRGFSTEIFDVESEIGNSEYNDLFNEDKTIKEEYQFKMNKPYQALTDIATYLLSQIETEYDSYLIQIETEKSIKNNDDVFVFDDIIYYQNLGDLEETDNNNNKLLKTLSMANDTKYSELSFGNNTSLEDSDSIVFPFYTDKDSFTDLVNENTFINRMINYFKSFYNLKDFYIIAKSKEFDDYIFYSITNNNEIEFFTLITRNNFNKIQIERLSVRNKYINRERFKKSISFKRVINDF